MATPSPCAGTGGARKSIPANYGKKVIVIRGLAGSGKSRRAIALAEAGAVVFSADTFFMKDGVYVFNAGQLNEAHSACRNAAWEAMRNGALCVVIDNTNATNLDMRPYVAYAQALGYEVEFVEPDTPWKYDVDECALRNTHNVPKDTIQAMRGRWVENPTIETILACPRPGWPAGAAVYDETEERCAQYQAESQE